MQPRQRRGDAGEQGTVCTIPIVEGKMQIQTHMRQSRGFRLLKRSQLYPDPPKPAPTEQRAGDKPAKRPRISGLNSALSHDIAHTSRQAITSQPTRCSSLAQPDKFKSLQTPRAPTTQPIARRRFAHGRRSFAAGAHLLPWLLFACPAGLLSQAV